jgi:hypothetical protein
LHPGYIIEVSNVKVSLFSATSKHTSFGNGFESTALESANCSVSFVMDEIRLILTTF